jgi:hypothetical protein
MNTSIVSAIKQYVDIEGDEQIDVAVSTDPQLGTVYSVNIPVRRVRATISQRALTAAAAAGAGAAGGKAAEGITFEWDEKDWDADPSSRFPMGA